ncbi:MAG: sensor domain-containing diguanylate cyclase [Oscillospiraceae bacterium]
MKKYSLNIMKFAVGFIILLGVLLILLANEKSFRKIVIDDIENISKLSSSIIYAEIDNSLTKPIFVGQTMANDLFLKNWLSEETENGGTAKQKEMIQKYLMDYREKYDYDIVFMVSAKSNIYYCQEGINKVVSQSDAHDVWYYDFIKSGKSYDLDVDFDEVNSNQLTVFVNCDILDNDGNLMGVVGVGIKMSHLQELLRRYEKEYDLRAFLINEQGLVQVDAIAENIEVANFFNTSEVNALKDKILGNKDSMQNFWYPEGGAEHCLITKYVDNLDWYLVIEKNTARTEDMLTSQINRDLLLLVVIIVLVLSMISYIIGKYNRMLLKTASIDDVTNLPNVKMFQEIFNKNSRRPACREGVVFMFDIDHFKNINDRFGHLFGNTVLYRISEVAATTIGNNGLVARWGGDEFVGAIYCTQEQSKKILQELIKKISEMEGPAKVTISIGATGIKSEGNLDMILKEADVAMYRSKKNGRNQITFFNEMDKNK